LPQIKWYLACFRYLGAALSNTLAPDLTLLNKNRDRYFTVIFRRKRRNLVKIYELNAKNENTKWKDAMKEEVDALLMVFTSIDHGKIPYLVGFKNYSSFSFDVKQDIWHKAHLVAGGHLTNPRTDGTYSVVVNLHTMRIAITVGEMNDLKIMVGDVSSAYLEAYTQEKVSFIAGPDFGIL
jgi:hypothetical protein